MGQLLNGKQLIATRARQLTISANCDIAVGLLAMNIAAIVTLLAPTSVYN